MCTDYRHCSRKAYYSIQYNMYVYGWKRRDEKMKRNFLVVNCVCVVRGILLRLYTYVHTVWNGVRHDTMNEQSIVHSCCPS